ncbi:MAG: VOC family protein [Candidatus Omnitrophota bacterium]
MKTMRHTGIVVEDLEKMLFFYRDLLGLKVIERREESSGYIEALLATPGASVTTVKLSCGNSVLVELLHFHSDPSDIRGQKGLCVNGISHIAFTVGDIDAEYGKLAAAGVAFVSAPQDSPDGGARVAFCRDFEGNFIELVEEVRAA